VKSTEEAHDTTHAAPPLRDTDVRVRPPAPLTAADRADRIEAASRPHPGYAVRLAIPAIDLDTEVRQAGVKQDQSGKWEWETLPFVAAHYGDLTSLIGAPGNAVVSGHVVTLNEGNVFRSLYKVDLGSEILVWDHREQLHRFQVVQVKLVPPSDVSVLDRTPDPTLTLITCGGTFDPVRREFSDRLVVVARPTHSSP
jgi:LPXTG-site transpeptidase (sortase) family protein